MSDELPDAIIHGIAVEAPIDEVWTVVSEPGWWIMESGITPHRIEYEADDTAIVHDERYGPFRIGVEKLDAPHRAVFSWLPDADVPPLQVTFVLESSDGGTDVEVRETGFAALSPAQHDVNFPANIEGWVVALKALGAHFR